MPILKPLQFFDIVEFITLEFPLIECVNPPIKAVNVERVSSISIRRDVGVQTAPYSPTDCAYIVVHMDVPEHDYQVRL